MKCPICGAENPEANSFCVFCGAMLRPQPEAQDPAPAVDAVQAPVPAPAPAPAPDAAAVPASEPAAAPDAAAVPAAEPAPAPDPAAVPPAEPSAAAAGAPADTSKSAGSAKMKWGVIILIAVAISAVICAFLLTRKPSIDLDDYLTFESSGYDGYGTASASIDWKAIGKKYGSRLSFTDKAHEKYGIMVDLAEPLDAVRAGVSVEIDGNGSLSNGDTVTYHWVVDETLPDYVKVKLKYKEGSFAVSGLQEIETFDAFADLDISFGGFSPVGTASLEYNGSELTLYDFALDKAAGLSNGDTVTVSIKRDVEWYINSLGKAPARAAMQYTVEGLPECIDSYADLTEDFINTVHAEAEDTIYASVAQADGYSVADLTYCGYNLNIARQIDSDTSLANCLNLIYSGTVSDSQGRFHACKVFFPVSFGNIVKLDGSLQYTEKSIFKGVSALDGTRYTINGFVDPFQCYESHVTANRDAYRAECGDGFEAYADQQKVAALADIDEAYRQALCADALDQVEGYIASNSYITKTSDLTLEGDCLLAPKDPSGANRYAVVYSTVLAPLSEFSRFDPLTVYFAVAYDGVLKLPDGSYMTTASCGLQGFSFLDGNYGTPAQCYTDGAAMFSAVITANRENFTCDVSEGLKKFGE